MTVLEIEGLRQVYRSTVAVDGVSLSVAEGEVLGLLGPNGSGKTTTVETAVGLRRCRDGSVRLWGLDPFAQRSRVRRHVGVQLQESQLHGYLTVREVLTLHASFHPDPVPVDDLLADLGLGKVEGVRFDDLSGGQQQRVSIAAALVGRPRLAVLDELTTGLDPRARRTVWGLVERLRVDGVTVVLVSHAMDEVERLCDRVVVLVDGRVAAHGRPADLLERTGSTTLEDAYLAITGAPAEDEEELA